MRINIIISEETLRQIESIGLFWSKKRPENIVGAVDGLVRHERDEQGNIVGDKINQSAVIRLLVNTYYQNMTRKK